MNELALVNENVYVLAEIAITKKKQPRTRDISLSINIIQ